MSLDMRNANIPKDRGKIDSATMDNIRQQNGTEFTDKKTAGKKNKNEMGKDDFIKLMSAQLKYQDPINPMKNEQMAAQLAQFSALEQMVNVNQNLEKMAASAKPQENMMAASLIGKRILTDSTHITYDKKSEPEIKFDLPKSASTVSISILNAKGEVVREIEMPSLKEGRQSIKWNGKANNGLEVPAGDYGFRVAAMDEKNAPMDVKMSSSGLVTGVEFEGGKAMLLVGTKKIPLEAVSKIEDSATNKSEAANKLAAASNANEAPKNANTSSTKAENGYVKNAQNNLQSSSDVERINTTVPQQKVALSDASESGQGVVQSPIPGVNLWNPDNM